MSKMMLLVTSTSLRFRSSGCLLPFLSSSNRSSRTRVRSRMRSNFVTSLTSSSSCSSSSSASASTFSLKRVCVRFLSSPARATPPAPPPNVPPPPGIPGTATSTGSLPRILALAVALGGGFAAYTLRSDDSSQKESQSDQSPSAEGGGEPEVVEVEMMVVEEEEQEGQLAGDPQHEHQLQHTATTSGGATDAEMVDVQAIEPEQVPDGAETGADATATEPNTDTTTTKKKQASMYKKAAYAGLGGLLVVAGYLMFSGGSSGSRRDYSGLPVNRH